MCIRDSSYTMSPVHTLDSFLDYGQKLKDLGADSICIKDMAGMLTPCLLYTSRCV